jgi:hypothetical protein
MVMVLAPDTTRPARALSRARRHRHVHAHVVVEAPVLECHERLDQAGVVFRQRHPSPQLALGIPHGAQRQSLPVGEDERRDRGRRQHRGRHGPEAPCEQEQRERRGHTTPTSPHASPQP